SLPDPNGTDGEMSTTPAEDEAQACLVDPSTPVPTAKEEAALASRPSEHPLATAAGNRASARVESQPSDEIRQTTQEEINREEDAQFLSLDLDPDKVTLPDLFAGLYGLAYD